MEGGDPTLGPCRVVQSGVGKKEVMLRMWHGRPLLPRSGGGRSSRLWSATSGGLYRKGVGRAEADELGEPA